MPVAKRPASPVEVFYSYSHRDEELRNKLEKHLTLLKRSGVITGWHDRKITAGSDWKGKIDEHLKSAKVILLLISADFLASDYCYDIEAKRALWRHSRGLARVIPVILRACDWHIAPLSKLQALPTDGKPVTSWTNRDEAFTNVARGIREAIREMTSPMSTRKTSAKPGKNEPNVTTEKSKINSTSSRPKTRVASAPAPAAVTPKDKSPISPGKQPGVHHQRPVRGARTSKSRTERTTPTVATLPRDVVARQIDAAFHDRPRTNLGVVWVQVVWGSLRADAPLKPTLFVDEAFRHDVQNIAHSGKPPLFPFGAPNEPNHTTSRLQVIQHHATQGRLGGQDLVELTLYANGIVSVALNVTSLKDHDVHDWSTSMRINPDDVQMRLEHAWGFASRWWKHHFGTRAAGDEALLYNIGLFDTAHYKFERPPQGRHTGSMSLSMRTRPNPILVHDEPKLIPRSVLLKPESEIKDVIKMLEMRFDEVDTWK